MTTEEGRTVLKLLKIVGETMIQLKYLKVFSLQLELMPSDQRNSIRLRLLEVASAQLVVYSIPQYLQCTYVSLPSFVSYFFSLTVEGVDSQQHVLMVPFC